MQRLEMNKGNYCSFQIEMKNIFSLSIQYIMPLSYTNTYPFPPAQCLLITCVYKRWKTIEQYHICNSPMAIHIIVYYYLVIWHVISEEKCIIISCIYYYFIFIKSQQFIIADLHFYPRLSEELCVFVYF